MSYDVINADSIIHINFEDVNSIDNDMSNRFGVNAIQLMETAGFQVSNLVSSLNDINTILIVCGKGNNAGDGLVAARYLKAKGYEVELYLLYKNNEYSELTKTQFEIIKKYPITIHYTSPDYTKYDLVIDAILGSGSKYNLKEPIKEIVTDINTKKTLCLSIDTPTGINTDTIIKADYTITFGFPKKIFLEKYKHCGKIYLADIGIMKESSNEQHKLFKNNTILKLEYKNG